MKRYDTLFVAIEGLISRYAAKSEAFQKNGNYLSQLYSIVNIFNTHLYFTKSLATQPNIFMSD